MDLGTKIRLAYHKYPEEPRLLIFGPLDADFRSLRDLFMEMAGTPGKTVQLHEQSFAASFHGIKVQLSCAGPMFQPSGKPPGVWVSDDSKDITIDWVSTDEGWDYSAFLLDNLVEYQRDAHHYLSMYPDPNFGKSALVIVSKGEYDDEVVFRMTG
jgi:hypothetical protein